MLELTRGRQGEARLLIAVTQGCTEVQEVRYVTALFCQPINHIKIFRSAMVAEKGGDILYLLHLRRLSMGTLPIILSAQAAVSFDSSVCGS